MPLELPFKDIEKKARDEWSPDPPRRLGANDPDAQRGYQ